MNVQTVVRSHVEGGIRVEVDLGIRLDDLEGIEAGPVLHAEAARQIEACLQRLRIAKTAPLEEPLDELRVDLGDVDEDVLSHLRADAVHASGVRAIAIEVCEETGEACRELF